MLTPGLAGCDSTYQQNARAKIAAERRLGAQDARTVTERGPDVRVERVTLLRDRASTAIVVDLRSRADRALTDVPISVGVRRGDRKVLLNDAPELDWFQTHLPAIAARGRATWVFRSPPGGRARPGDTPFVRIGAPVAPFAKRPAALPAVRAQLAGTGENGPKVTVSGAALPQFGLPVNVIARRGGVPVAAGTAIVSSLDRGEEVTVEVPLTGRAGRAPLAATTTPTIFE